MPTVLGKLRWLVTLPAAEASGWLSLGQRREFAGGVYELSIVYT